MRREQLLTCLESSRPHTRRNTKLVSALWKRWKRKVCMWQVYWCPRKLSSLQHLSALTVQTLLDGLDSFDEQLKEVEKNTEKRLTAMKKLNQRQNNKDLLEYLRMADWCHSFFRAFASKVSMSTRKDSAASSTLQVVSRLHYFLVILQASIIYSKSCNQTV